LEVIKTIFKGLLVIQPKIIGDNRGYFFESFSLKKWEDTIGETPSFVQDNESMSKAGVLRGLHFQKPPFAQGKLVRVVRGSVLDVVVDIRKSSDTYGQHFKIVLSEENKTQLYVPEGFAHGFLTMENDTIFSYKCTNFYNQKSEDGLLWNDPDLEIDWSIQNPILSEKDMNYKKFNNFDSPFN